LSLAKKFAELLGGNVAVTSEEGRGSRFSVVIPIRYTANK
jgi:signal transduction histidine kinase